MRRRPRAAANRSTAGTGSGTSGTALPGPPAGCRTACRSPGTAADGRSPRPDRRQRRARSQRVRRGARRRCARWRVRARRSASEQRPGRRPGANGCDPPRRRRACAGRTQDREGRHRRPPDPRRGRRGSPSRTGCHGVLGERRRDRPPATPRARRPGAPGAPGTSSACLRTGGMGRFASRCPSRPRLRGSQASPCSLQKPEHTNDMCWMRPFGPPSA